MVLAQQQEEKLQMSAVNISLGISILLFLISLTAGIISDSIALLLDASAGFVIVFTAFMLQKSIKKVNMPPDHLFNFGYEKFEPFTVVIQGAMIILSCVIASKFAIQDIFHPEDIVRYDIPTFAALASSVISGGMAIHLRMIASKTNSTMLKVSSFHWVVDMLLSLAMCLGFTFGWYMLREGRYNIVPYVDPVMALILALILIWPPLKIIRTNFLELVDAAPLPDVRREIDLVVEKHKARAFGVHHTRMRKAGRKVFLEVCFLVHGNTTMNEARIFADAVAKDMAAKFPKCDIIVHFHPAA
jgi:cation diffusion facilitator family transporter